MKGSAKGKIIFKPIGVIRTPYTEGATAPRQAPPPDEGEARLVFEPEYSEGLRDLERFKYIYVLFHLDRARKSISMTAHPPSLGGKGVGLFSSRSPNRPNPIGLSIVRLKRVEGNEVVTSLIDALDGTPILDIKPYFRGLDSKPDADKGWRDKKKRSDSK